MTQPTCVFVIDDESSVRRALQRLLRASGYSAQTFACADEFLAYTGSDQPACLIVDVRMPGKTGLDLLESLRVSNPSLPIIFITGHGDIPMAGRAMKAGAADFLSKPFEERELFEAIDRALRRDAQQRSSSG